MKLFKLKAVVIALCVTLCAMSCQQSKKVETTIKLNEGWEISSSAKVDQSGESISLTEYETQDWVKGNIPATVMSILRQNGQYSDLYFGKNFENVDKSIFQVPWWYRKNFTVADVKNGEHYQLRFEGLNYKANIWLNGKLIADSSKIEGAFGRWTFDVTKKLQKGNNVIAVEVIPPKRGDLTIGFVDWNPAAPDENMGLWRGVTLMKSGVVSMDAPMVSSVLKDDLSAADLQITHQLNNHSDKEQDVELIANVEGVGVLKKNIKVMPNESFDAVFTSDEFSELNVQNPKLWWPNNMGEPTMYNIEITCKVNGKYSHHINSRFGIREFEEYLTKNGHKGYKINGQEIVIKGAGWVDDVLLADSDEKVRAQVEYVKHMNMNCIRLEGFWGRNKTLYDAADENGLLLMIGWSCHWEWEAYCGRPETHFMSITGEDEIEMHAQSYRDQVMYLRNHPSVFLWVFGSDKLPVPELESKLNKYIGDVDGTRPMLASCKGQDYGTDFFNISEITGHTGVKMLGPYSYVPPSYWYVDTQAGGAYGFNTETGPGPQVPPMESLKRMIPESDLWPVNDMWNFHCGRHEFGTLNRYTLAFNNRYGQSNSVEDFTFRSQVSNYEAIRPMFESFQVNRHNEATGVIQWMLNSAWPEMFWQLYDYYLVPNGAFYGTRKACQPLNPAYNYKDNAVYLTNDFLSDHMGLTVDIKILDINSKEVFGKSLSVDSKANTSIKVLDLPVIKDLSETYFLSLKVNDANKKELADNFYWLSTKSDVMDFPATSWVGTPQKEFANLKGLNSLGKVEISESWSTTVQEDKTVFTCQLENKGDEIAFFIETAVLDPKTNQTIVPVFWDNNYVSLLPGESKVLKARICNDLLPKDSKPVLRVRAWNKK
ncbi:glycosyl hydrolase 2 galactose-binding domain-containing protein [Carboxylicivirga sp. N1Y90]|uniref:glycosyl hydrolase 2 galactose-binding domain-containing protein n=1 Tax=Carboxylicivirga fragile TaxID=3417571 RepID=UPI003D347F52|nr:hypothetical protein [Marinilabiliaceae bacterium N1Y90]